MLVEEGFPKSLKHVAYKIWSAYTLVKDFEKETKNVSKASSRSKAKMNRALANLRFSKRKLINDAKPSVPNIMIAKIDTVIKGVDSMLRLSTKPSSNQFNWLYVEFTKVYLTGIDWSRERVKLLYNTGLAQ